MYPMDEFKRWSPDADPYRHATARISFEGLEPKDENLPVKLSLLASTYHRYSQLRRMLYTLCKQTWKEFEVLICDDGDDYDLKPIFAEFAPYLRIRTVRRERAYWRSDPCGGFRALLPLVDGEIVAIMQPELMLVPEACWTLYYGHFQAIPEAARYSISQPVQEGNETWVALKPFFLSQTMMGYLDTVDWQNDVDKIQSIPEFWSEPCGLSRQSNSYWSNAVQFPWWFCASGHRESGIWGFPEYLGHASIDFWTMDYRRLHHFIDIVPARRMVYHQEHHRFSFAPEGEVIQLIQDVKETVK